MCERAFSGRSVIFHLTRLLERRLDGFSSNHHQNTFLRCHSLLVVPHENRSPKILGAQNVQFGARKREEMQEKLKQLI